MANWRTVRCASSASPTIGAWCAPPRPILRNKGRPQHPDDLADHECILMRFGQTIDRDWPFLLDGKVRRGVVRGQRSVDEGGVGRGRGLVGVGRVRELLLGGAPGVHSGHL